MMSLVSNIAIVGSVGGFILSIVFGGKLIEVKDFESWMMRWIILPPTGAIMTVMVSMIGLLVLLLTGILS